MMIHGIGRGGDTRDERDAVGESVKRIRLDQRFAAARPSRQSAKRPLNFHIGQFLSHSSFYNRSVLGAMIRCVRPCALVILLATPAVVHAQLKDTVAASPFYWRRIGYGVTASLLLHETAHVLTSLAAGGRPTFGFDRFRPTVFSGISVRTHPRRQFLFSASGLAIQSLLNEAILDVPHVRGNAFERGLLAGGIGTTAFYLTIGRWGSVSDVEFMTRTRVMNRTQITLLFGSVAASHALRISRNGSYADFFAVPRNRGLDIGLRLPPF